MLLFKCNQCRMALPQMGAGLPRLLILDEGVFSARQPQHAVVMLQLVRGLVNFQLRVQYGPDKVALIGVALAAWAKPSVEIWRAASECGPA